MAEEKEDVGASKKPGGAALDPILDRSLSGHFALATGLLFATVVWACADEFWFKRPYKSYQGQFRSAALEKAETEYRLASAELEKQKGSPEYQQAAKDLEEAEKALQAARAELNPKIVELTGALNEERKKFQVARGDYQPLVYDYNHAVHENHPELANELQQKIKKLEPDIQKIFNEMNRLGAEKSSYQTKLDQLEAPVRDAQRRMAAAAAAQKRLGEVGLRRQAAREMGTQDLDSYQIYNPALGLVDRCRSCHIATDKSGYTEADWEAAKEGLSPHQLEVAKAVFDTHPNLLTQDKSKFDWLSTHNIAKFGCTSCHWGNGPATTEHKAHGLEGDPKASWTRPMEFQLTPILPLGSLDKVKANEQHFGNLMESACGKCHATEVRLKGAPQLSYGRQIVEDLGCWGCHKIKGFELRELELQGIQDKVAKELTPRRDVLAQQIERLASEGEEALEQRQELSNLVHEIQIAQHRAAELDQEIKFIGPDLNREGKAGLKSKIYWPWLARWIYDPQHFRPGTWMPNSLMHEQEAIETAAYIWQQAKGEATDSFEPALPGAAGDQAKAAAEGRRIVEQRGCIACHTLDDRGTPPNVEALRPASMDGARVAKEFKLFDLEKWWEDPKSAPITDGGRPELLKQGEFFGPSLAKVGEKIRYEWLVQWVKDPKSLQPHTRMPNLRLTDDEAKAVAAFLTTLRAGTPAGERETFAKVTRAQLEDPKNAAEGLKHVVRYGCFNCHAIDLKDPANGWKPVPNPGKIGAELSSHGSKPLAQFDFGFLEKIPQVRNVWLQTKVLEPRIWDVGQYKGDPADRLRMPRFGLNGKEAAAVTTILAGMTDQTIPAEYMFKGDARQQAIIEGERLVRKFNCRSCHVIDGEGQYAQTELMAAVQRAIPGLDESGAKLYMPPILNGQGHRGNPEWTFKFLKNPGLYQPLRPWHVIRMPTFDMSDAEANALVAYFVALENERYPYEAKQVSDDEALVSEGRGVFVKAQCASCHKIGEFETAGKKPTEQGPNLAWSKERLRADWIERFVPDPQAFIPGANMPSFFNSKPFALQSPQDQRAIQALRAYIRQLDRPEFREQEGWTKGGKGPGGPR